MGISLDAEATDWLWLNLSLDEEDLLSDQKEKLIQKAWVGRSTGRNIIHGGGIIGTLAEPKHVRAKTMPIMNH